MIEAAAGDGYAAATVGRVVQRAGVSRATFYQHFGDREDCFHAAYDEVAAAVVAVFERSLRAPLAGDGQPRHLLAAVLAAIEADPAGASLFMLEARGALATIDRRHAMQDKLDGLVAAALEQRLAEGLSPLRVPSRALLGGVENVLAVRLHNGDSARICALLFDLLAWIDSYSADDLPDVEPELRALGGELGTARRAPSHRPRPLPRGRSALSADEASADRHERIIGAMARLSRERGYAATTVADLTAAARVSRGAFYRSFSGKHEVFLAAQTIGLQRAISLAAEAFFGAEDWPDRVWRGLEAMLSYVASRPDLAWVDVVESYAVGRAAVARSIENRQAFSLFLEQGYAHRSEAQRLPRLCSEAIGGAIQELMRVEILAGRTEEILAILPQAVYVTLAPFVGPAEARCFVAGKVRERAGCPVRPDRRRLSPDLG
ncbi:MAG: TetR/AcrR family transcriptional regulator [Solirubrobacterales bacterium]